MTIDRARRKDLGEVVALEREIATAPHWSEAEYRAIVAAAEGSVRRCVLVSRRDRELVGFAVGKIVGTVAELESVAVRGSARRGGVGRALCEAMVAWAWAEGASVVELEVRVSNAGAIELYAGLGFRAVGRRRGYYSEPLEDAVLMCVGRDGGA